MNAAMVLEDLRKAGARVALAGDRIRIEARQGQIPAPLKEAARECRDRLREFLLSETAFVWIVTDSAGRRIEVCQWPPLTRGEVEAMHPGARSIDAEPSDITDAEWEELRQLINQAYGHEPETATRMLELSKVSPTRSLRGFRRLAERGWK